MEFPVFSCDIRATDGQTILAVTGDLDYDTCDRFWESLRACITPGALVVVDGAAVNFVDTGGLRTLLLARQTAHDTGAGIVLATPSLTLLRLLELTGIADLFSLAPQPSPQPSPPGTDGSRSANWSTGPVAVTPA